MKSLLDRYLDRVLLIAGLPEPKAEAVRQELRDHLLQKIDDLIASGTPRDEAPLEALRQHGSPRDIGYRLRGPFPWIDIRAKGTARGFVAIGPKAIGVFAFGGWAVGVFAFGGLACGLVSLGGAALGLLFAFGGCGVGGLAYGGFAMGLVAAGGFALGIVADGGQAIGLWAPHGGHVVSYYASRNVPAGLKSLAPLLRVPELTINYWIIFWPVYFALIAGMNWAMAHERRRTDSGTDWLVGD